MDWFSIVGNIASIAGLIVSIYVLYTVKRIRVRYVRQAMLETCLSMLRTCREELAEGMENREAERVRASLSEAKAVIRRTLLHLPGNLAVEWSREDVDAAIRGDNRKVYSKARFILASLDEWIPAVQLQLTEMNWGRDDD